MRQYEHAIIDLKANQYIEEDVTLLQLQLRSIPLPHAPQHPFHIGPRICSSKNGNKTILIPRRPQYFLSYNFLVNLYFISGHAYLTYLTVCVKYLLLLVSLLIII